MKPGPATSAPATSSSAASLGDDRLGQRARIGAGALGQHHRRVGGEIAMRRIARRLDRDRAPLQPGRERAFGLEGVEHGVEMRGKAGVERHGHFQSDGKARL